MSTEMALIVSFNGYIIFLCMAASNVLNDFYIHELPLYFQFFALTNNATPHLHELFLQCTLFLLDKLPGVGY